MKEKINKNIESQNRDVKNYKPIRIRFKRSSRYKPGYIKSRNFIIRHPWYNKKRQLTTLPSGIIYNIFDKNTSFHNPPLPSSTQLPIEKYNMEKLLSLGYSSVKAQELTWLLKFHSRFIRKEQYKYKRAFESIQKVNILEKEGYKHWTVRRDERIKAEALKNKNIIENKNKNIIENKKENINTNIRESMNNKNIIENKNKNIIENKNKNIIENKKENINTNIRESIKNKNIIENKAEVYSHTSNIPIEKQNTKKALTANTIKVDKSDNNLNKFINNSNKSPIYIYNPMSNNNRSQSAPIKQMPLKKDPFSLAFKSFVHSLIWKRNNAVTFSSLALDMKFKKLFTTLGMKKRFHKPSTLFKVLRHSRLYKSLLGYLRDSIKSNNNKLANLCRLSIIKFLSHWTKGIFNLCNKLNDSIKTLAKQFYSLTLNLVGYNWSRSRPNSLNNIPLKVLKSDNKWQSKSKRDRYDRSLRKLLSWYMSGKILTAQKNVKKRLTAKLDRIFFIRSHIFHDTFVFNNLRYLYPLLTNKFIDSKVKQLSFLKASAKLNVYSTSVVLHYWKFMMFYGNVNTFGLTWANNIINLAYREFKKPKMYLKTLYLVQLYKFLLFSNYKFSPFFFAINHYLAYKNHLNTLSKVGARARATNIKYLSMPLADKIKRLHLLDNNAAVLYGYKFHFVGRFTRKQQSANLWFTKGSLATSAYSANIDYATYTVTLRYSACTIKVWLYRPIHPLKYTYRIT